MKVYKIAYVKQSFFRSQTVRKLKRFPEMNHHLSSEIRLFT
jgi:hypothetical protein